MESVFFPAVDLKSTVLEPGKLSRTVKARGGSLMAVEVSFATGAVGAEHEHPHEQLTYCLSGRHRFSAGGETRILEPGDSVYVAGGLRHGTVCLAEGRLLDLFSPQREDFLVA